MRRFLWAIIALLVAGGCEKEAKEVVPETPPDWVVEAQERAREAQDDAVPEAPKPELVVEQPIMWRVSGEGGESTLLGTFHVGTDFHGPEGLPPTAKKAFDDCEVVVLEADVGAPDMEKVARYIVYPPGKSLSKELGADHWEKLQQELPGQSDLEKFRPHIVVGLLSSEWIPEAGVRGMDGRFIILARAYDKRLGYLETPEEQLKMLSESVTVSHLKQVLDRLDVEKQRTLDMFAAFKAGDAERVHELAFPPEEVKENRKLYSKLFWERNRAWVDRLRPHLDAGNAFVAVGAGHLLGEESLPQLLQEAGYEVERVR